MQVSRRNFLRGASACAVAAAAPMPKLVLAAPPGEYFMRSPPIFEGSIGTYQGVVIRTMTDERAARIWDRVLMAEAKKIAATCHPGVRWGTITETVLEGIEVDGGP